MQINQYANEALVINDEDWYDVDFWNGTGWESRKISGATLKEQMGQDVEAHKNFGASTYYTGLGSINILSAANLNLNTLFDNASKVTTESTSYYDLEFRYSRSIVLSGTSGSANIVINGVTYPINFTTNLNVTTDTFVLAIAATMAGLGIQVYSLGASTTDGRIRFCSDSNTILDGITITNTTGTLSGVVKNEFSGTALAQLDHFKIPYPTEVSGQLLNHTVRLNILLTPGSLHHANVGLIDISDDSIIEYYAQVNRNPHTAFNYIVLDLFTISASDQKVKNGFYLRFNNPTNTTLTIYRYLKMSVVTRFQNPTLFP